MGQRWNDFYSPKVSTALMGLGLIVEVLRSHSYAPLGRILPDEWSARRRELLPDNVRYLLERQKSMIPAEFEPAIATSEWPQT